MKSKFFGLFFCFYLVATPAYASVLINEIARMGGAVSSTDEWIELYNPDASPVDLAGWRILADDGSPAIVLSGNIPAGGYFLIERTDDDSVLGIPADLVVPFGNGLGNTGETLRLKNASDADVDVVVGGADWASIGGDNATKETAQRTANSWVTGSPTPRAENVAQSGEVLGASTENATSTTSTTPTVTTFASGGASKPSLYPRKTIFVEAGSDMRGFVGFPISFIGSSTGLYNESLSRATYRWNFGDGSTGEGERVAHVYDFAGEYVVTLEVFWAEYHERDRLSVVVSIPDVSVSETVFGVSGYVRLVNRSEREIDLSGWVLRDSAQSFTFPPNSIILPKKSFTLSNKLSGLALIEGQVVLSFPQGGVASTRGEAPPTSGTVAGATDVRHLTTQTAQPKKVATQKTNPASPATNDAESATSTLAATVLWEKSGGATPGMGMLSGKWMFAIIATMFVVLVGIMVLRGKRGEPTIEEEYAIIEDIIEGVEDVKAP